MFMPVWPVYIVGDDPQSLTFTVQVGEKRNILASVTGRDREWGLSRFPGAVPISPRAYRTVTVQHRLHQQSFRDRVIEAYRQSCAVCRLHHDKNGGCPRFSVAQFPNVLPLDPAEGYTCLEHLEVED